MKKLIMCLALVVSFSANAGSENADTKFSKNFQCPEFLKNDNERGIELKKYLNFALKNHPDWQVEDFSAYRVDLLKEHNCNQTLSNMR